MKRRYTSLLSGSLVLAMAVAVPAAAQREEGQSPQDIKSQEKSAVPFDCQDTEEQNFVVFNGDLQMWPPNHKYQDLFIDAEDRDGDGDDITLTTTVTHDEYVADYVPSDEDSEDEQTSNEEQGAGHTANDASPFLASDSGTGQATTMHQVRSERSGRGDGRTYTIDVLATFDGDECTTSFAVEVPHDMRSHNAPAKEGKTG